MTTQERIREIAERLSRLGDGLLWSGVEKELHEKCRWLLEQLRSRELECMMLGVSLKAMGGTVENLSGQLREAEATIAGYVAQVETMYESAQRVTPDEGEVERVVRLAVREVMKRTCDEWTKGADAEIARAAIASIRGTTTPTHDATKETPRP